MASGDRCTEVSDWCGYKEHQKCPGVMLCVEEFNDHSCACICHFGLKP